MEVSKKYQLFLKVSIPALMLLFALLEVFFRWCIPARNIPVVQWNTEHGFVNYTPYQKGHYTLGKLAQEKYFWSINNEGWNAPIDYHEKSKGNNLRVAVIGDSYIEAFQTDVNSSYPSVMRAKLEKEGIEVYSFGLSGTPMSHYLYLSRYVKKLFDPDVFVFNVVHNDFSQSIDAYCPNKYFMRLGLNDTVQIKELLPVEPNKPTLLRRLVRKSALYRYLFYNARLGYFRIGKKNKKRHEKYNANINVYKVEKLRESISIATNYILKVLKKENEGKRIVFVMDAPRKNIYADNLNESNVIFLEKILKNACDHYDIEFISLTDVFKRDYKKNQKKFNSPFDSHWNTYGHWVVGNYLSEYVQKIVKLNNKKDDYKQ